MTTDPARTGEREAARDDRTSSRVLAFKRTLTQTPTIENLLELAENPLMCEMLSNTELGYSLFQWVFFEVLPELTSRGYYEADQSHPDFKLASIVIQVSSGQGAHPPLH